MALFTYLAAIAVILLVYKYLSSNYNYWKDRGIKYETPIPIFGNYIKIFLGGNGMAKYMEDIYYKYPNDKMIGLFRGKKPELFVKDLDLVRQILIKDFYYFPNRSPADTGNVSLMNKNLFSSRSDEWKSMRKRITPIFSSSKLRFVFPLVVEKGENLQEYIAEKIQKDNIMNMSELLAQLTTDVIGSVAFGIETGSISARDSDFRRIGKKLNDTSLRTRMRSMFIILFPRIARLLKMRFLPAEIEDFFVNTVRDIVKYREDTDYHRNDIMDLLIEMKNSSDSTTDGEHAMEFDEMTMAAQAFIFFLAGYETSSTLMSFTLNELSLQPEILKKVVEEVDTVLKRHNGKINYDAICEMTYLETVIYESMRKYPPLGILTRFCVSKYTFPGTDITIDEDVKISIPVKEIHYDPKYYPEPQKFIPERFTKEERNNRDPMTFLSFGEGPRICIALRFGKMQSMVGLVSVLSKFKIERCEKTEEVITLHKNTFLTSSEKGIWLKVTPRTDLQNKELKKL